MKAWPLVPLGEIVVERKVRIGTIDADRLPLLGVSNKDGLHRSGMPRIPDMSRYLRVEREWFAYNPMRVNVGSIGWAHSDDLVGAISPDYVVFSCTPRIDPRLLYWFLTSEPGLRAINLQTAGSVRERLYFGSLSRVAMPLPSIEEQRRLIKRLDDAHNIIGKLKRIRADVSSEIGALSLSVSGRVFASRESKGWKQFSLGEIAEIRAGVTLGRRLAGKTTSLPYLRVANVQDGHLDLRVMKEVEILPDECEKWRLLPGDILLTEGGDWDKLGRGTVWNGEISNCIHQNHIFRLRVDLQLFAPSFLVAQIGSPEGRSYFQGASKQTTNLASINQRQLKAFPVYCPPLEEQCNIVARLGELNSTVTRLRSLGAEVSGEIAALERSIINNILTKHSAASVV